MIDIDSYQAKLSFIEDDVSLTKVSNIEELREIVASCRETDKKLSNYDFSPIGEISCVCFDGLVLSNIVFSRFCPCRKERAHLFQLSFVGATLNRVSFAHADILQCNFDASIISKADFFYTKFDYCRFRKATSEFVDYRYSQICNCTLSEYNVTMGDFYFCNFLGSTSFVDSKFVLCSFTFATFENACIRVDNIKGIIQEKSDLFHDVFLHNEDLHWNRYNPCASFSTMNHFTVKKEERILSDVFIAAESMNFYRQMSGIYAGKGLNRDSNVAYKKKVLEERKYCRLKLKAMAQRQIPSDSKLHYRFKYYKSYLTQAAGYGYKWWTPCLWFMALVLISWVIYQFVANMFCLHSPEWLKNLAYSFNNSLSPFEDYYRVVNIFVASLQSACGILLIGFLGFVVANKIRNDS